MLRLITKISDRHPLPARILAIVLTLALVLPEPLTAYASVLPASEPVEPENASAESSGEERPNEILDTELLIEDPGLEVKEETPDSILVEVRAPGYSPEYGLRLPFNPSPTRAVWLSALVPGLGQVYNRRYWKLPIIIAGFMGLGYGTSWNNTQFNDYSRAYADLMDADPNTKSYMDFFPPTTSESDLDHDWLARTLKNRKNYYRRNRELCIIFMVGVYLLCMVDAYVDATMAHFDISPDLSLDIQPTVFPTPGQNNKPSMGLQWALNF